MDGFPASVSGFLEANSTAPPEPSLAETATQVLLYLLIFALGLPLNVMVLLLVSKSRPLRSITNMFVASLALADLLVVVLGLPFVVTVIVIRTWPLGATFCQISGFLTFSLRLVSILCVAGIAVDRYYIITRPFTLTVTREKAKRTIVFLWWAGLCCGMPPLFGVGLYRFSPSKCLCDYSWTDGGSSLAYSIYLFIWVYLMSLVTVTTSYYLIYRVTREHLSARAQRFTSSVASGHEGKVVLKESKSLRLLQGSLPRRGASLVSSNSTFNLSASSASDMAMESRTAKTILGVVATFLLTWLPYFINNLRPRSPPESASVKTLDFLVTWLTFTNCVLDPVLYALLNRQFRRRAKGWLGWWFGVSAQQVPEEIQAPAGQHSTQNARRTNTETNVEANTPAFLFTQELQRSASSTYLGGSPLRRPPLCSSSPFQRGAAAGGGRPSNTAHGPGTKNGPAV